MPVHLSSKFFKNERQNYSNWPLATFRELFQNAVDQDADEIDITLTEDHRGIVHLTFSDNGPGMSRKVLHEVYFALGESTKDQDPSKIGGMGRARLLTCFSMLSYRIYSQDYEVASSQPAIDGTRLAARGSDCESYDHPWTAGCKLVLEVDDTDLDTMHKALERFLYESRLTARVTLNGRRIVGKSLHAGRHIRDLTVGGATFARIWVNKSVKTQRVIVRVNGVSMFTASTNANAQIVVELEPSLSRNVLTASRDGLRYRYQEVLNGFLNELAVDTSSALRSRLGRRTTVMRSGGMRVAQAVQPKKPASRAVRVANEAVVTVEAMKAATALYAPPTRYLEPIHTEDTLDESFLPTEPVAHSGQAEDFAGWLARTFGDIYVFDETDSTAMRKAIASYQPSHWTMQIKATDGRPYRRGGKYIRVLLLWHTAISYALEVAMGALELTEVSYAVGFVFPNDRTGADHRDLDGGHVFSLCPVDAEGRLTYSTSERRSLKRMMALAKHEVTHVNISWHGEAFSSLREQIDIEFDETECLRRMKAALQQQAKIN